MAVQATDLLMIERAGVLHKAAVSELPAGGGGGGLNPDFYFPLAGTNQSAFSEHCDFNGGGGVQSTSLAQYLVGYLPACQMTTVNVKVTTAVASTACRLAVYRFASPTNPASELIYQSAEISTATTGLKQAVPSNLFIDEGLYSLVISGNSTGVRYASALDGGMSEKLKGGFFTTTFGTNKTIPMLSHSYGSFPSSLSAPTRQQSTNAIPLIFYSVQP